MMKDKVKNKMNKIKNKNKTRTRTKQVNNESENNKQMIESQTDDTQKLEGENKETADFLNGIADE